ncbi:ATP-binding protein [Luteimonas sp. FCS-9]|uniref:sensor histidine kinase n=1 Tax=Luteimonas sp. FCS-9 TaxID=1547516 RepID=UPI00063EA47B|nr:ATP-binding protein [Luteimonas sp. FCS-9]KLJ00381.1 hypothetical protein WQ56_10025 [Luteimonas sp. FCS-9]
MRPRSLAGRLMLAALVGVLAAVVAALVVRGQWQPSIETIWRSELEEAVRDLADGLHTDADGRATLWLKPLHLSLYDAMPKDAAYRVVDADGRLVAQSDDGPALRGLRNAPGGASLFEVDNGGTPIVLQALRRDVERDGHRYAIAVARSDRLVLSLDEYAGRLSLRAGVRTALLMLLVFLLVVFLIVRQSLRPVRVASELAARIGPRNLSARLRMDDLPTELVPLIEALNNALGRLEQGYRVQQAFLATAAHELKTPLALLRGEIELGGAANREVLLRDTALMARQVHQLLHLAEVSEGHNYTFDAVPMHAAAFDAADYLARLADTRGVAIEVRTSGTEREVEADGGAVFVLLKNLLENAIHHTPRGGSVRLHVSRQGFAVEDDGAGVAPAQRARLFQRFGHGDGPRGDGAGLGLAICREICLAHGWHIALDASHAGPGARFVVAIAGAATGGPAA